METTCAALVATYLAGVQLAQLDKTIIYEIPAATMAQLSVAERVTARGCAMRLGIRYRVVRSQPSFARAE